jgi:hypothetical protein
MGRRKRTSEVAHSQPVEASRPNCAAQTHGAGSPTPSNTQSASLQSRQCQLSDTVGRHSSGRLWLLLAAIVLEAAWLCLLLVMVLRRW